MSTINEFLKSVSEHQMTIELDSGVHRSLFFGKPGSGNMHFRLNTWLGHLCISGDMGTFVFSRVSDMFQFFRDDVLSINPGYWGEKLQSISQFGGYMEFDEDRFRERVTEHFTEYFEDSDTPQEARDEIWSEIESRVFTALCDGEYFAYHAVRDFDHEGFRFQDFLDGGGTQRFTYHYIWCLYAIVWGIRQYDKAKAEASE